MALSSRSKQRKWPSGPKLIKFAGVAAALLFGALVIAELHGQGAESDVTSLAGALSEQKRTMQQIEQTSSKHFASQVALLDRIARAEKALDALPSATADCSELVPPYEYGAGILQVASVVESRGDDTERFAATQVTRLRTLLKARSVPKWPHHVSHYLGRGQQPTWRVVFNNVSPGAGRAICAWLRCEKWTGGCAFIDEKGETHPEIAPKYETPTGEVVPSEYPPTEDLYENWKVASAP